MRSSRLPFVTPRIAKQRMPPGKAGAWSRPNAAGRQMCRRCHGKGCSFLKECQNCDGEGYRWVEMEVTG